MFIQQYSKDLNYNLMQRNLKSCQIVWETPAWHHILDSPVRFLQVAVQITTWRDSVCRIHIDTQLQDKSYAASGHMEALSSVYMLFHFCRFRITHIWNLNLKQLLNKAVIVPTDIYDRIKTVSQWKQKESTNHLMDSTSLLSSITRFFFSCTRLTSSCKPSRRQIRNSWASCWLER